MQNFPSMEVFSFISFNRFVSTAGVPANNVVQKLKQEVTTFKQGMPAIISLRNHALRSRHWDAVQLLMQRTFIRDKYFTLGVLLKMNVSYSIQCICF